MRLINLFLILNFFFVLGCKQENPNAFKCVLISYLKDEQGNKLNIPFEQWYWYCKNMDTEEVKRIPIQDSDKCIRNKDNECRWIATDLIEYDISKKFYEGQCGG